MTSDDVEWANLIVFHDPWSSDEAWMPRTPGWYVVEEDDDYEEPEFLAGHLESALDILRNSDKDTARDVFIDGDMEDAVVLVIIKHKGGRYG
jgi:hypothetical protein